ncbi:MAG: sugar phosphate isomerase/epimerase [Clostridia bacterium]|nr:sugar phosphate isomerase/epimerase [Clostridia bacterium]
MKISIATGGAFHALGVAGGLRAIREAGFDGVDLGLDDPLFPRKDAMVEAYRDWLLDEERIRAFIDPIKAGLCKYGLTVEQIHAPASYVPRKPQETDIMQQCVRKTIALCAELGCRNLVVHPIFDGSARYPSLTKEQEYAENIAFFASLIPLLKQYRVTCCLENAYCIDWGTKKIYASACSDMNEANHYIDTLNALAGETCFGFCLDTGHLLLTGGDTCNAIELLGNRLKVLHVHDNDGCSDDHTLPFTGVCNWSRFIRGLRATGYRGNINIEASCFVQQFPPELAADALRMLCATASYFRSKALEP